MSDESPPLPGRAEGAGAARHASRVTRHSFRLIALDVDGTTLDPSGIVRPRVAAAIAAARERGCVVALATGRRLESARRVARGLAVSYLILTDGTVVYDLAEGQMIREECFTPDLQGRAIGLLDEVGLPPVLFESPAGGDRIVAGPLERDNPETRGYLDRRAPVERVSRAALVAFPRIVTILGIGSEAVVEAVARQCVDAACFSLTFWRPTVAGYELPTICLGPPNTSKGNALHWLAARLGIPANETLAVGDHLNDVSLLSAAGLGVAMGNALPEVKAVAAAVVADHSHDGVAEAIEKWVLPRSESPRGVLDRAWEGASGG